MIQLKHVLRTRRMILWTTERYFLMLKNAAQMLTQRFKIPVHSQSLNAMINVLNYSDAPFTKVNAE